MNFRFLPFAARCRSLTRIVCSAALIFAAPGLMAQKPVSSSSSKKDRPAKSATVQKPSKALKPGKASTRSRKLAVAPSAQTRKKSKHSETSKPVRQGIVQNVDGLAESRLLEVYRLINAGNALTALDRAQALVKDFPNFQLAQLVYGDLLMMRIKPVKTLGDVPAALAATGSENLQELRSESRLRTSALKDRPPAGMLPSEFLSLSRINKHVIAIDVSKARLYLFEHSKGTLRLLADYYVSVGKAGTGKLQEGDQRTPLGLYFVTSTIERKALKDMYGAGALPVNYPNALDIRRGKTGGGIWLHGTPSSQFTRAPFATDGCVAVSNPDLERILRTVEIRTTPVLIAKTLSWVSPSGLEADRAAFSNVLQSWAKAKSQADPSLVTGFYAADFTADEKTLAAQAERNMGDKKSAGAHSVQLTDVSFMRWTDEAEIMIATFGEVTAGSKAGKIIRQYWQRRNGRWQIIYEAVLG